MSWVRGQQKGEGRTDNPTTGGRGGQTAQQQEGGATDWGDRQSSRRGADNFHDREAGGAGRLTEGRGCGQTTRRPEGARRGGTDDTTGGGSPDNQAGGMGDRRSNRTRGLRTELGRGLGGFLLFVIGWLLNAKLAIHTLGLRRPRKFSWPRGVTVSTLDSESSDRGSNPREALLELRHSAMRQH